MYSDGRSQTVANRPKAAARSRLRKEGLLTVSVNPLETPCDLSSIEKPQMHL